MPRWDSPPHAVTVYGPPTTARDAGGGETITWGTVRQAAVPCLINTASSATQEMFAQQGIVVTHTVGIRSDALTSAVARGDKVVADDNSATYLVEGIRAGRAVGNIPAFTMLECRQIL